MKTIETHVIIVLCASHSHSGCSSERSSPPSRRQSRLQGYRCWWEPATSILPLCSPELQSCTSHTPSKPLSARCSTPCNPGRLLLDPFSALSSMSRLRTRTHSSSAACSNQTVKGKEKLYEIFKRFFFFFLDKKKKNTQTHTHTRIGDSLCL